MMSPFFPRGGFDGTDRMREMRRPGPFDSNPSSVFESTTSFFCHWSGSSS